MTHQLSDSFTKHFETVDDPRRQAGLRFPLIEVLFIAICAIVSGADDWVAIERFGKAKQSWFAKYLRLKHGIPSHDTFGDVFGALDPDEFGQAFIGWMEAIATLGGVVALDGKTVRHSWDKTLGKKAVHMVTAWSVANRLVLGQVKTDDKSNEITTVPELLRLLAISGCLITLDAMGCQTAIAAQIVDQQADYLLAVKGNQGQLYEDVTHLFKHATPENYAVDGFDTARTVNKSHGRVETRTCYLIAHPEWLTYLRTGSDWKQLAALICIISQRQVGKKISKEMRFYITSRLLTAADALNAIRSHWEVENNVHWVLDVVFAEDNSRIRAGHAQQNLATMRRIAINLLNGEHSRKQSLKGKRQLAGWDESYLEKVVFN